MSEQIQSGGGTVAARTIWRLPKVLAVTGLSRASIYDYMAEGTFPRQVHLGPRAVGWLASDVEAWLDARVKASKPPSTEDA